MLLRKKKIFFICFIMIMTMNFIVFAEENILSIYAGNGSFGYKDGNKTDAEFRFPYGLDMDNEGNIYVADSYNNLIRKIQGNHVITMAGTYDLKDNFGFPMGGLVDGSALEARFNKPRGVALDSKGNLFIADTENHVIRKLSGGKVYTFAGTGQAGYKDGQAASAQFYKPTGIVLDSEDNIYVSDTFNHVIRKISTDGSVTTYAGKKSDIGGMKNGTASAALFNEPSGIAVGQENVLYVFDSGNQLVRKIKDGQVITVAGSSAVISPETNYAEGGYKNGKNLDARFNFPKGIDVTDNGTILIADTWNNRVRAITPEGKVITIAGGTLTDNNKGKLNGPVAVHYAAEFVYISSMWDNNILRIPFNPENPKGITEFDPVSDHIQVWVDGVKVFFPDMEPYIENGKTMVPLRFICEEWRAEVNWLQEGGKVQVKKGD